MLSVLYHGLGKGAAHITKNEVGRMKLDFLQFLELEVFTRFGSRLEPGLEKRIHRSQILQKMLKQDLLSPLTIEFQMAWLVAYNEGLFDNVSLEQVKPRLAKLGGEWHVPMSVSRKAMINKKFW
ncbi:MAG: hypothetical protein NMNS01_07600 [Nitrosomonas sp.]|nr:MAG: hypothetical protein NMNS01_07600 [Nitrosomonas sp.]